MGRLGLSANLFPAIHTIYVSVFSLLCVRFQAAKSRQNIIIHNFSTSGTTSHRYIHTAVIEVLAVLFLNFHHSPNKVTSLSWKFWRRFLLFLSLLTGLITSRHELVEKLGRVVEVGWVVKFRWETDIADAW